MIKKINMIVLIFLTIFLISSVSATEFENETITTESAQSKDIHIETKDVEMYYKDGTRFIADIHDENMNPQNNTPIMFNINNMNYSRNSNENGQASIALNLNSGRYTITTTVNEISVNNTINVKSTIYGSDIVKMYRNSTQYYANFLDSAGENLKNTEVSFNINGVQYKRTTNENGIAKLNLNLIPGNYILTATNPINDEKISNNITILSTIINNKNIVKYYRNGTKYSVTILENNGQRSGAGKEVEFNINGVFYKRLTNPEGVASLNINLNPGDYIITAEYENCKVSNMIKILPTLRANDIIMSYRDGTAFNAYLVDGIGDPKAFEVVTFNINGVFYKRTTNENGIAKLNINLQPGEYIITSENNNLHIANKIMIKENEKTENEIIKNTTFTYEIKLPNYVNITFPYVFENSVYSIKTGINGIIRMEKNQLLEIEIGNKTHVFATGQIPEYSAKYLGSEYWLLPFDNSSPQHSYKFENLTGNGIILQRSLNYTNIIYRNNCSSNLEQFGAYMDKFIDQSEIINYIQNGKNIAKIKFQTMSFDETGLKYTLAKYYGKSIYDFYYKSYVDITNGEIDKIKFANTNEQVTFSYFGTNVVGTIKEENIITKFNSTNCIEFEKSELITYGLSDKYKGDLDVLQSFAIINKKITDKDVSNWINKEVEYKSNDKMQNMYTMFLTSLNTAYLSDKLSDNMTINTDITWSRTNNTVILGGINWKETFIHVLTPDMGMTIKGNNESDIINFRFVNSILLSKIEQNSLTPIAQDAGDNVTSVFDDIFNSLKSFKASVVFYNNTAIISDQAS